MEKHRFCEVSQECGRLCSHDNGMHLLTRLEIIEGQILEHLEKKEITPLRELMDELNWQPCAISMAVGSLVRQGVVKCAEYGKEVFIGSVR